jgi:3'(2'), 5'-bisphosphate nucleotidase
MMTSTPLLSESEIDFVCDLAKRAGDLAASMRETVDIRQKSGPHDLITDADLALSELILKEMGERFPGDFVISEEAQPSERLQEHLKQENHRTWLIDPIDGTDNYVQGDGQYSVMIGLLMNGEAHFGCIYGPATKATYYGGPAFGSWKRVADSQATQYKEETERSFAPPVRIMMGWRDSQTYPWVKKLKEVQSISSGSVGLRVAKILEDEADLYVHLSGKLKLWDTAGPVALALASGLEVGTLECDMLNFPLPEIKHSCPVIIGRKGALTWSRKTLSQTSPL